MNIFEKLIIRKHSSNVLLIHRDSGLAFWLFFSTYFAIVIFINSWLALMSWEAKLPRSLTCWRQQQTTTCNYLVPGIVNGKKIQIIDVKKAISSQSMNEENIVITSSQPWIVLGSTSNNIENVKSISLCIERLNSGDRIWKMDLYASTNVSNFIMFLCYISDYYYFS